MKVIFLDIDDVLNSEQTAHAFHAEFGGNGFGGFFDSTLEEPTHRKVLWGQDLVDNLKFIVDNTGAAIVVSSTWRLSHSPQAIQQMLRLYGLEAEVIDRTLRMFGPRGEEIDQWLNAHPEVDAYVILDDSTDMLASQLGNFVQTDDYVGLTRVDAVKAVEILNQT